MSLRFQADADLKFAIVKAVREHEPGIDFASAVDAELEGISDLQILERAAQEDRILVTHDRRTMIAHFRTRLAAGKESPGLLVVSQRAPLGAVVSALILVWSASAASDWRNQVHHLPSFARHFFTH